MNSTGCGFLMLAIVAVVVGFVPILAWTNYVVALPMAVIAAAVFAAQARKEHAQAADYAFFWISSAFMVMLIGRLVVFSP